MKEKVTISTVPLVALFLTLAQTIQASTTWYLDGVHGNDSNNCFITTNQGHPEILRAGMPPQFKRLSFKFKLIS